MESPRRTIGGGKEAVKPADRISERNAKAKLLCRGPGTRGNFFGFRAPGSQIIRRKGNAPEAGGPPIKLYSDYAIMILPLADADHGTIDLLFCFDIFEDEAIAN